MECSRCGGEAVVKRENAVYCGKCALARDWEEVIPVAQADRMAIDNKPSGGAPAGKRAENPVDGQTSAPAPEVPATPSAPSGDPFA